MQDNEAIDVRFNELTSSSPRMINMARRMSLRLYVGIDIGREYTPEGIILHMAGNDLEDLLLIIGWQERVTVP